MADPIVKKKGVSLPKWMLQGVFYGLFLGVVGYLAGGIALTAAPAVFPASIDVVTGALGFLASLGIAYTNDVVQ